MRLRLLSVVIVTAALISGCATGGAAPDNGGSLLLAEGVRSAQFSGQSIIYTSTPSPTVIGRKFESTVEISIRGVTKSYRFKNHFAKESNLADVDVVVAISGATAGFGVYDTSGARLAEYSKGRVSGNSIIFSIKTDQGSSDIKWYFSDRVIGSVIESFDKKGKLFYSEMTTYQAIGE